MSLYRAGGSRILGFEYLLDLLGDVEIVDSHVIRIKIAGRHLDVGTEPGELIVDPILHIYAEPFDLHFQVSDFVEQFVELIVGH